VKTCKDTTSGAVCRSTEEEAGGRVVKITPVVTVDSFDSPAELSRHISKEMGQSSESARFKFQGKGS
jgi:hypothetical protein